MSSEMKHVLCIAIPNFCYKKKSWQFEYILEIERWRHIVPSGDKIVQELKPIAKCSDDGKDNTDDPCGFADNLSDEALIIPFQNTFPNFNNCPTPFADNTFDRNYICPIILNYSIMNKFVSNSYSKFQ